MNTRAVQAGVATRISSESVTLVYYDEYDNGDGSATPIYTETVSGASVGKLQAADIQRLELAGIIVRNGITVVLPFSLALIPDTVIADVDEYETGLKYRVANSSLANGITVLTCDQITLEPAEAEE